MIAYGSLPSLLFTILRSGCLWRLLFLPHLSRSFVPSAVINTPTHVAYPPSTPSDNRQPFTGQTRSLFRLNLSTISSETHGDVNNNEDEVFIQETTESTTSSSFISSCPFSKTYPRYRIDLTTSRRKKGHTNSESFFFKLSSPFRALQSSLQNAHLEQQLLKKYSNDTSTNNVEVVIQPEMDGITAFAYLWEQAATMITDSKDGTLDPIIIALPDASPLLVRNFVEIVEWMYNLPKESSTTHDHQQRITPLRATVVEMKNLDVPAVHLERTFPPDQGMTKEFQKREGDANIVNRRTRKWVQRILVEQGICPFTKSDRMSGQGLADLGVPVGSIAYHASFQSNPIGLFAETWRAIHQMIKAGPSGRSGVSSILLASPVFDDDFDFWAGPIFAMLEASVVAAQAESEIGVVCFHPRYATPDGKSWPGFGHMHSVPRLEKWYNEYKETAAKTAKTITLSDLTSEQIAAGGAWQRRTPHATINVLRAKQLEMAESRRESAKMYTENIEKLVGAHGIGNEKLGRDLNAERQLR
ncbi:DUF1415 domain containing protein [Nitzschia inconspicua]|uniref:DUF1415 domain containing protein n=1 Tax=Nitzschia inconspicua TaxID=303405 RepID=A0A9K3P8B5_9STRA|nr:DUF1415 domain containing protein [Nitzschia inconspicua]KAG7362693.1 DUF1415 domain containing protein [Nitzschia inconspicua]